MGIEEEREPGGEGIDVQATANSCLHIGEAVGEGEGQLLGGGGPGLPDVIAAHRNRVPQRDVFGAELDHVDDEPHVRLRWEDPLLLGDVFLEDVVLQGAAQRLPVDPLFLGGHQEEGEQHLGRTVDGHRHRDVTERDAVEEPDHVVGGTDGHPAVADLSHRAVVVGVEPHQRRHVEGDREPALALAQ